MIDQDPLSNHSVLVSAHQLHVEGGGGVPPMSMLGMPPECRSGVLSLQAGLVLKTPGQHVFASLASVGGFD